MLAALGIGIGVNHRRGQSLHDKQDDATRGDAALENTSAGSGSTAIDSPNSQLADLVEVGEAGDLASFSGRSNPLWYLDPAEALAFRVALESADIEGIRKVFHDLEIHPLESSGSLSVRESVIGDVLAAWFTHEPAAALDAFAASKFSSRSSAKPLLEALLRDPDGAQEWFAANGDKIGWLSSAMAARISGDLGAAAAAQQYVEAFRRLGMDGEALDDASSIALGAILSRRAWSDPALAAREFVAETTGGWWSDYAMGQLLENAADIPEGTLADITNAAFVHFPGAAARPLAELARRSPESALEWWLAHAHDTPIEEGTRAHLTAELLKASPGLAPDLARVVASGPQDSPLLRQVASAWATVDLTEAENWARSMAANEGEALEWVYADRVTGDPELARRYLALAGENSSGHSATIMEAIKSIARTDGVDEAAEFADTLGGGAQDSRALAEGIWTVAANENSASVLENLAALEHPELQATVLGVAFDAMVATDSDAAFDWIARQSGPLRALAVEVLVTSRLQNMNLPRFEDILVETLDTRPGGAVAQRVESRAKVRALEDPVSAAAWAETVSDPAARDGALAAVAAEWSQIDPPALSQWLGTLQVGNEKDRLIESLVTNISSDPERGFQWSLEVSDDSIRLDLATGAFSEWVASDRDGAVAAIANLPRDSAIRAACERVLTIVQP